MALTSRRKRPIDRNISHLRDASLIIIATEGSVTELRYFPIFSDSRVQVTVIPSEDGRSAPAHVLANLLRFRAEFDLGEGDGLWLALDVDRWPSRQLSEVAQRAQTEQFLLAVSNPCFELWFALHVDAELPVDTSCDGLQAFLRATWGGYNKSNPPLDLLRPGVDAAVTKARTLDISPGDRWPQTVGTHVYRIIEQIRGFRR
jgi:hypothetical protein